MLNFPVTVNPAVLGAGGNVASQNALFLSDSLLLPTNTVKSFGTVAAVTAFFGAGVESEMAAKYFAAHDNSAIKPSVLLFAPYNAATDTPTTAMNHAAAISRAWVTFSTTFEPSLADKKLFAEWVSAQNQRYAYVAWDTDALAIASGTGVTFGEVARALAYDTVLPISGDAAAAIAQGSTLAQVTRDAAAFICGVVAATDYTRKDGRVTACFRTQAGLLPTVIDNQNALNLAANGYSFYGQFANSVNVKNFFSDGKVSGKWNFLDSFAGQVYLNTNLQTAIVSLMIAVNSLPYNQAGYSLARAAMNDPISAAKNAGIIRTGVSLSASQIAQINQTAGQDISSDLVNNGFFLQILDPGAQARAARGTPIVNLWYTDGGAIQSISLASINVL